MASATQSLPLARFMSGEEYLSTTFRPDWIFDPQRRVVAVRRPCGSYTEQSAGTASFLGPQVAVDHAEVFAALNQN